MASIQTKAELEKFALKNWNAINDFLVNWQNELPLLPIYSSVDIRESSQKFAAIDHNLYPAGFNNICSLDLEMSVNIFKKTIYKYYPETKTVSIIPESNTKNTFYLDHLNALKSTLEAGGFQVFFTSFDEELFQDQSEIKLLSHSEHEIIFYKSSVANGKIMVDSHPEIHIDFALLNNDQSRPLPVPWTELTTPVHPSPGMGWYCRQKNIYFKHYEMACQKFAEHFSINPDLLSAKYKAVDGVDFSTKEGLENLAKGVDQLISETSPTTKVFLKPSQGTYGMGISVVNSGEEVLAMNRKERNKMDIGKNHIKFTSVLVQEGIETIITYDGAPAEITIYLVGGESVGGFMRTNKERGTVSNLNSKGMVFKKFCFTEIEQGADHAQQEVIYSIIARLANIASGLEMKELLSL